MIPMNEERDGISADSRNHYKKINLTRSNTRKTSQLNMSHLFIIDQGIVALLIQTLESLILILDIN